VEQDTGAPLTKSARDADCCLQCKKQGPGDHYVFFAARKKGLSSRIITSEGRERTGEGDLVSSNEQTRSHRIIHEERVFICDRCARARVGFAPLAALIIWVPLLALGMLLFWSRIWLSVPLLLITIAVVRLAWKQLRAVRYGLYRHPPYNDSIARLAIKLRKREVLRAVHLPESEVTFLTELERGRKDGISGAGL
jgi:hypothetical protein